LNLNYPNNISNHSTIAMDQFILMCTDETTLSNDNIGLINPEHAYRYISYDNAFYPYYRVATIPLNSEIKKVDQIYFVDHPILGKAKKIIDLPNWYDLEFCINAIEYDGMLFCLTKFQNEEMCLKAVEEDPDNLKYVIDQTEKICLKAIELSGYALKYVKNQTEKLCKKSVMNNGGSLSYITDKTPELCYLAVQNNGLAISHIFHQTEEMCLMAIENNPKAFRSVMNKTDEICRRAVEKDPYNILQIKNPNLSLVLLSLSKKGQLLFYQTDKTEEMCKIALQNDGMALRCVNNNQTEELVKLAITNNGFAIKYVKDNNLLKKYQDQALNQIKARFADYFEFVPFYLSILKESKSEIEQLNIFFEKYTKEQLLKIIKQRNKFQNYIFNDTVDDKKFNRMEEYYSMYGVKYGGKNDFELALNVGEFNSNHFKMVDCLVLLEIELIFDFILGKYEVMKLIKPLYDYNFSNIFDNLEIEEKNNIIYHNCDNDIISNCYILRNEYVNGILTPKRIFCNDYRQLLFL